MTSFRTHLSSLFALSVLTIAGGCGGGGDVAGPPVPTTVTPASTTTLTATVGAPVAVLPSVRIRDQRGNPILGVPVTFSVTAGGGTVDQPSTTTNSDGVATVGGWTLGTAAGANTLAASDGTLSPVTFTAIAVAGAPTTLAASAGDAQTAVAGSAVAVSPSVIVKDANGNPVAGISVTFAVASGGGSVSGGTQTTGANGVATAGGWTLGTTLGANTLVASSGTLAPVTFSANAVVGAAASITKSAGDAQSAVAGSAVSVAPSVTITDANGHPVPGISVAFAVASGGGSVSGGTQTTNASGVATVGGWTLGTTAGANTLSASAGSVTPISFSATGIAGAAATITKSAGDGQSAVAGSLVTIRPAVTVKDANGNPVAGASVVFAATSGGGSAFFGSQTTSAAGVAIVGGWTLGTTVGPNTLSATSGSLAAVSFSATGTAGPPATITKVSGDGQTADPATQVSIPPSVVVRDANGNLVPGSTVTFSIGLGGGSVTGGTQTTSAAGAATVGSWSLGQVGANTLLASVGSLTPATFSATANASPDPCALVVPYTLGNNVNGDLDASDCHLADGSFTELYGIHLNPGAYQFTQTAAFDTHPYLATPLGVRIAESGGPGVTTSSFKTLLPDGDYKLGAGSFNPAISGSYTVSAISASVAVSNCGIVFLVPGITTTQILQTFDCSRSSFYSDDVLVYLTASRTITVTMTSTVFDARLEIWSTSALAASNDNKDGTTTDAEIVFTAPADGYYRIVPTTHATSTTGVYTLKITPQ